MTNLIHPRSLLKRSQSDSKIYYETSSDEGDLLSSPEISSTESDPSNSRSSSEGDLSNSRSGSIFLDVRCHYVWPFAIDLELMHLALVKP